MDLLELFDGTKSFTPIKVVTASHRMHTTAESRTVHKNLQPSTSSFAHGTDYVSEYIKREEAEILADEKLMNFVPGRSDDNFEGVSMGTELPGTDIQDEKMAKIYETYNFAHRTKENLTISSMESKIVSMIDTNHVTIIQGPTGCGKTTQVPQFILDSSAKKRIHCNIIVTQPRRIAAISIAKRVSEERSWPVGTLVGYQVGMVNHTSPDTRLTYCTTGVLLHKLINSKNMLNFTHVIIDEVHERDQDMDFLLLVVRKLQRTNSRSVKLILMSATFNVDKFSKYFSVPMAGKLIDAPIIDVAKRNFFNIYVHYINQLQTLGQIPEIDIEKPGVSRDMMDFCERIISIFDTTDQDTGHRYAVLVFLPGIWEIEEMHSLLTAEKNEHLKFDVVALHSSITNEEQQKVFIDPPTGYRRVILATNIAESSITVPGVKYVIDFCLTKQMVTDPKTNFQCLEIGWASKANCEQRAGRAGRTMDGRVYRLVPQYFFDEIFTEEGPAEMLRAPLENVVLKSKILDMGEPKAILALSLDPPDLGNLERTILLLKEAGALMDNEDKVMPLDGILTDLGRIMSSLPVDIRISKLIILGHMFSVLRQALIIGASMAVKNVFSAQFQQKLYAYKTRLAWAENSASDCISFLNVYNMWMFQKGSNRLKNDASEKRWAHSHHLQIRILREIEAMIHDMTIRLRNLGIVETTGVNRVNWDHDEFPLILKIVIAGAFYPNYYTRNVGSDDTGGYKTLGGLDPTKTVYLCGWPMNQPGQLYARRIQKCFEECVSSKAARIIVSFDNSTKVYVQFRQSESSEQEASNRIEEPGEISMSVYKAIKLRTIGPSIDIPVMNFEASIKRAEQLGLTDTGSQVFLPVQGPLHANRNPQSNIRPLLPSLDTSCLPLVIQKISTPGHFWARLQDPDTKENLDRIKSQVQQLCVGEAGEMMTAPEIGSLVLAPRNEDGHLEYYRALVLSVCVEIKSDLLAKLLFIDIGEVDRVRVCNLRKVSKKHPIASIPSVSFECVLSGIRPVSVDCFSGQWSPAATEKFYELMTGKQVAFYGEVYSVVNSVVHLKLFRVEEEKQLCLNDILVQQGFAEFKDEDYLSRLNHELRQTYSVLSMEHRKYYEELQYDQGSAGDIYPDPPDWKECPLLVKLRGPYSPLEISLNSLARAGFGKKVTIDNSSVNSVVLDTIPDDPHDRLLVAGSVTQNPTGSILTLRNTTLMPNIPGLTSLLGLIFAPQIELRHNRIKNRYIGALCGLGYDPVTKKSLFPEHDMHVHFDVNITIDDLQEVNRIRHWMSTGICVNRDGSTYNSSDTEICQNRIKKAILTLLNKRRKSVKREDDIYFGQWCRYDERLFIPPGKIPLSNQYIYRLHNALEVDDVDEEHEEMLAHLKELRELSSRHHREGSCSETICKFCNVSLTGVYQLRSHLVTKEHVAKTEKYLAFDQIMRAY